MGFLKRFFRSVSGDQPRTGNPSSFEQLTDAEIETHLEISRYGDFLLSDAVRPSFDLQVIPEAGFRHDLYRDEESQTQVPVLMAAASKESLFELFIDLLDPLGMVVDVVLETSHARGGKGHTDLYREHIDMPVLKSMLYEYEELLVNDGCTGIAVMNSQIPLELQFDEHKLLIMYGEELGEFEQVLESQRIPCNDELRFITEGEHVHSSSEYYRQQFDELKMRLGMDSTVML